MVSYIQGRRDALGDLIAALKHEDAAVRMRAADVAEKISVQHPEWFQAYAGRLLALAETTEQQEIRWHMAQMFPRLKLAPPRRRRAVAALFKYLDDRSRIVQVSAITALVDLSLEEPALRRRVTPLVLRAARSEAPSVRARAKKLLARLSQAPH